MPPSRGEALVDLSDRQPFLPRPADDVAGIAEAGEGEFPFGYVGKRTVEIVCRQIEPAEDILLLQEIRDLLGERPLPQDPHSPQGPQRY